MQKIILFAVPGVILLIGIAYLVNKGPQPKSQGVQTSSLSSETRKDPQVKNNESNGSVALDLTTTNCTLQANGGYFCPATALQNFGPVTLVDTGSQRKCTVSYNTTSGFTFTGGKYQGTLTAGTMAVGVSKTSKTANIIRNDKKTLSLHINDDGVLDHILFVNSDYTSEQCIAIK